MQSLIFFGSDRYSAIVLEQLLHSNLPGDSRQAHPLHITVITDPHAGGSPVEQLARAHNLPVTYYPTSPEEIQSFASHLSSISALLESNTPPLGLCASFDHLIPPDIIKLFGGNLYNLHPSLLPQYRNVSPVQYAIALGDQLTGITLFRISPGIDDGQIIAQAEEPIKGDDTTPTLTPRLFTLGAQIFLTAAQNGFTGQRIHESTKNLVFTKRLTRDSGYIEWSVLHRLLKNQPISPSDTTNKLLKLRLNKIKSSGLEFGAWNLVLSDLCRSLTPWPTVWSTVPTKKGELRITLESVLPKIKLKIAGKPNPITYSDFTKYYL